VTARSRLAVLMMFAHASIALAETGDAPIAEISVVLGGRAGSGTDDSLLLGGAVSLGWRWNTFRLGLSGRAFGSRSLQSFGFDAGAFASVDFFSLSIDHSLNAGAFVRLDVLLRGAPSLGRYGFVPLPSVGLRAAGFSVALAVGPEIALQLAGTGLLGVTGEVRVGFEFVEIAALAERLAAQKLALPP
jgi:hypothetical protein